ncbi:MAG: HNH endonuclease [Bacteroidia bacterium]
MAKVAKAKTTSCIFCGKATTEDSIEHIVSESLGNKLYILDKRAICRGCNNRFSKFEAKAIPNTILGYERSRMNISTKKGKPGSGSTGHLKMSAMPEKGKNFIYLKGLKKEDVVNVHPDGKTFQVVVPGFNKDSEAATVKFLLKVGMEALHQSQPELYDEYDFTDLKRYLLAQDNADWPFISTSKTSDQFYQIPRGTDITRLKGIECDLTYAETENELLFRFKYGGAIFVINLLGRDRKWIQRYIDEDANSMVYPAALRKHFTGLKLPKAAAKVAKAIPKKGAGKP